MYSRQKTVSTIICAGELEERIVGIAEPLLVHVNQLIVPQPHLLEADNGGAIGEEAIDDLLIPAEPVGPVLALPAVLGVHALVDRREDVEGGAGDGAVVPRLQQRRRASPLPPRAGLAPALLLLLLRHCDDRRNDDDDDDGEEEEERRRRWWSCRLVGGLAASLMSLRFGGCEESERGEE